jgi:hypothetical protein
MQVYLGFYLSQDKIVVWQFLIKRHDLFYLVVPCSEGLKMHSCSSLLFFVLGKICYFYFFSWECMQWPKSVLSTWQPLHISSQANLYSFLSFPFPFIYPFPFSKIHCKKKTWRKLKKRKNTKDLKTMIILETYGRQPNQLGKPSFLKHKNQ